MGRRQEVGGRGYERAKGGCCGGQSIYTWTRCWRCQLTRGQAAQRYINTQRRVQAYRKAQSYHHMLVCVQAEEGGII